MGAAQHKSMGGRAGGRRAAQELRGFRERGEIPEAVGYGLPAALILLALLWPFLYGVVPSRAVWKSTSASGDWPSSIRVDGVEDDAMIQHEAS